MTVSVPMSTFATTTFQDKYAGDLPNGTKETWSKMSHRVATKVLAAVDAEKELVDEIEAAIDAKEFVPGGRYLYAAGRPFHQTQNCLLMRAQDSREGWAEHTSNAFMALMTGAGIGAVYSDLRAAGSKIRKTGGTASGPLPLMQATNELSRAAIQGGKRRGAVWAGLHWNHPDCMAFIHMKDWSPEVRALKEKDFNFPATMDSTNISVILDTAFFKAYENQKNKDHELAHKIYWEVIRQMMSTGEPGFSVNVGDDDGEDLRNAPVCGETMVLTDRGYEQVAGTIGSPVTVWTGKRWAPNVVFKRTGEGVRVVRVSMTGGREIRCDATHPFLVERYKGFGQRRHLVKVIRIPAEKLETGDILHVELPEVSIDNSRTNIDVDAYTLGYVYGDGAFSNCGAAAEITFCTEESKQCAELIKNSQRLSSINMCDGRGFVRAYFHTDHNYWEGRTKAVFPADVYAMCSAEAASFVAGLFDSDGNYEPTQKRFRLASKHEGFLRGVARLLEQLGIVAGVSKAGTSTYGDAQGYQLVVMGDYTVRFASLIPTIRVTGDVEGYVAYRRSTVKVKEVTEDGVDDVYCADVGVDEHSFMAEGVIVSNCTEITSRDDSDICNLGSINMARITSLAQFKRLVEIGIAFLMAGTVYSDVPYPKVDRIRTKNRRLGLGLMGLHEWLLKRGKKYGPDAELEEYLKVYRDASDAAARQYAKLWSLSVPIKVRALAPNGTIGIVAETTTSLEPIFCVAYKRRYRDVDVLNYQYVLDPTAKRLVDSGVDPDTIEDAYSISVDRRVAFQAWVQQYVDHGIASTINIPAWGSDDNNETKVQGFGEMLMRDLPKLRGITCYPDGARGGQPLSPVKYATAEKHVGQIFVEGYDVCDRFKAGSCGA